LPISTTIGRPSVDCAFTCGVGPYRFSTHETVPIAASFLRADTYGRTACGAGRQYARGQRVERVGLDPPHLRVNRAIVAAQRGLEHEHSEQESREETSEQQAHPRTMGLSRAAFARRFTALIAQPPLAYLTWWRMTTGAPRRSSDRCRTARMLAAPRCPGSRGCRGGSGTADRRWVR
jgi:hypothetical protein